MSGRAEVFRPKGTGGVAVLPISSRGLSLARKVARLVGSKKVYDPAELKDGGLASVVKDAFRDSIGLVFIGASGIAVRAVAPNLKAKHRDPAVVVVDERGRFAISLVSGHLGGANRLARVISAGLGATAVITTATDASGLPCIEDVAERFSMAIEEPTGIKKINSAILDGRSVRVIDNSALRLGAIKSFLRSYEGVGKGAAKSAGRRAARFRFSKAFPTRSAPGPAVLVSYEFKPSIPRGFASTTLILRPREFVVGLGCRRGVSVLEIETAVIGVLKEAGVSRLALLKLATIDIKSDERGLIGFASKTGLEVEFFSASELKRVKAPSGESKRVMEAVSAAAVSEPAALLSAGRKRLWVKKKKYGRVTAAVAKVLSTSLG